MLLDKFVYLFEEHGDLLIFLVKFGTFLTVVVGEMLIFFVKWFVLLNQRSQSYNFIVLLP